MRWDILVPFALYLVVVLLVGLYSYRVMQRDIKSGVAFMDEYFVAGRKLGPWVLAFTYFATFASAGTFIGYPGFAYKNGMTVIMTGINQIAMVYLAMGLIGKRMAQIGRRVGGVTFTDILRARFDHPLITIGSSIVILVFYIGYMIAQSAGGARVLQVVSGLPYEWSVILVLGIVIFYTAFGGMRAVANTDLVQGLFMLGGLIIVFPMAIYFGGGFEALTKGVAAQDPKLVFGPGPGNWVPLSMLISYWILWVWMCVGMPTTNVRFLTFDDSKTFHKALLIGTVAATITYVPMFYMGSIARIIVPGVHPDQAMPLLYTKVLPAWVSGFALAAPFAAIMSTVDSMLLVASSAIVKDIYVNFINKKASGATLGKLSFATTAILGILVLILSFQPPKMIVFWIQFGASGFTAAFAVPIIGALFWKRATTWGGIASVFGGFISYLLMDLYYKNPLGFLSFLWGMLISFILLVIVSYATKPQEARILKLFFGKPEAAKTV